LRRALAAAAVLLALGGLAAGFYARTREPARPRDPELSAAVSERAQRLDQLTRRQEDIRQQLGELFSDDMPWVKPRPGHRRGNLGSRLHASALERKLRGLVQEIRWELLLLEYLQVNKPGAPEPAALSDRFQSLKAEAEELCDRIGEWRDWAAPPREETRDEKAGPGRVEPREPRRSEPRRPEPRDPDPDDPEPDPP
jgi:hypothetical protein